MLEAFIKWRPTYDSEVRLKTVGEVLEQYAKLGIRLTLRQLYYQLVSKNALRNHQREYKRLGELLSNARLAGRIDWEVIEDRVRSAERAGQWQRIEDVVEAALRQFRLPRWDGQPNYIEVWCEKDALSSVFAPIVHELHVVSMVNRGYSSTTAMYDAAKRIKATANGRPTKIIYIGDFDPSGEDMVRDIAERFRTFGLDPAGNDNRGHNVEIIKLALTQQQIEQYKLPPNPAKLSDSRAAGFIEKHGENSYEVDALPPEVLQKLIREAIVSNMDMKLYENKIAREDLERARVKAALEPKPAPVPKPCAKKCCRKKKPAAKKKLRHCRTCGPFCYCDPKFSGKGWKTAMLRKK